MAVIIGSARHDENGRYHGGKAGDQTGDEVAKQPWYLHSKGWICIRAKEAEDREDIARDMEYIIENPNIGYDQDQNYTLYEAAKPYGFNASKVLTPCETDCARAVRVCVLYCGIPCADFYTGNEVEALRATGKFDILTDIKYTTTSNNLMRGDILVTKTKGHTVVVLTDGKNIKPEPKEHSILRYGDKGDEVKEMQKDLIALGFGNLYTTSLKATGTFGKLTMKTVASFQVLCGLKADGICGPETWGKIDELLTKLPSKARAATDVYLRKGPAPGYPTIGTVKEGVTVTYTVPLDDWIYIPTRKGWSKALYFELL